MAKKLMSWKTKGMNKDLSVSAFNPEFAFENINLRLSTNEGNTLLSWVNEKGTKPVTLLLGSANIVGGAVGTAIINHKLVLFTTQTDSDTATTKVTAGNYDHIYVLSYTDKDAPQMTCAELFNGNLNFSLKYPLETIVSYESETVQKVYWTDGVNQPRVINICNDYSGKPDFIFDFVSELQLHEDVTVIKNLGAGGMFAPGVIQYALTYYNKYGQESNVFYTTPLYYISYGDRGASPEDKVDNTFDITVYNVDTNFDYLRIYSIQRTSINGTPLCKRIQDIDISNLTGNKASYTDTGLSGDTVDPTVLLYLGGESISADTLEQKDNTLFLGNIKIGRKNINDFKTRIQALSSYSISESTRTITPDVKITGDYKYGNQLTSKEVKTYPNSITRTCTTPCGGFKFGNTYRCGVQFQYKTGKWSEPIFWKDVTLTTNKPSFSGNNVVLPILQGTITDGVLLEDLYKAGYRRVRAVVVYPDMHDRNVVCQGVANPTLYTTGHRTNDKDLFAQSSWFFRPYIGDTSKIANGAVFPVDSGSLIYTRRDIDGNTPYNPTNSSNDSIRRVEVQGAFEPSNRFTIDKEEMITLHSSEAEFNDQIQVFDFEGTRYRDVGYTTFTETMSDISIQTESPTIGSAGSGFIHKAFSDSLNHGIVSGLFYEDWIVDDMGDGESFDHFEKYNTSKQNSPVKWMVYLWNKEGSLNNDVNRPADKGTQTAVLKKKVISNFRFGTTSWVSPVETRFNYLPTISYTPQLFFSEDPTILKFGDAIYQGNIDSMLVPNSADGMYFAFGDAVGENLVSPNVTTSFTSNIWWKVFSKNPGANTDGYGIYKYNGSWSLYDNDYEVGKYYIDLVSKKEAVRMKYKSTPHLVLRQTYSNRFQSGIWEYTRGLPILEIVQNPTNPFGGTSSDALKENIWIPCGEPKSFTDVSLSISFKYEWGDTYFQRYDCLKAYPYTREDKNQLVEIGSFMLETYINIDGRYDRNRGQKNNLNMTPQNFNLINPVYSQLNNFFTYRIMDDSYYENTKFPNQLTWSKTKESGADVDQWTNVTLASILELDGDKGKLNKLIRFNNYLFAFQDTGISQILYNDNVQISATDGVPIEIANSGKVQGKDYKSNTIGCSNKWSMVQTPNGIYFMDSHDKSIYLFNGQLQNLSNQGGFASWAKNNICLTGKQWTPLFGTPDFVTYYDKLNQDILFINVETALAWSEKLQAFTSFYNYEGIPYLCNLDDTSIWIKMDAEEVEDPDLGPHTEYSSTLWKHQAGEYCNFFGENYPYGMTLVGNPEPQTDKIFTNLEFRACVDGEGSTKTVDNETVFDKPYIPFDFLETWDEYQHGRANINLRNGHDLFKHHLPISNPPSDNDFNASLIRKFRIWRCDIPRDNAPVYGEVGYNDDILGITRIKRNPMDRMRNPWLYLKLRKNPAETGYLPRTEIHDIVMTYFD